MTRKKLSGNHLLDFIGVDEKIPVWIGLDRLKSIPLGYEYRLNTFVLNYFWFSS